MVKDSTREQNNKKSITGRVTFTLIFWIIQNLIRNKMYWKKKQLKGHKFSIEQ